MPSQNRLQARLFQRSPLNIAAQMLVVASVATIANTPLHVHAQPLTQAPSVAQQQYSIPAGPLSTVLTRLSIEAGVSLAGATAEAQGMQSPGIQGTHSVASALRVALAGSGLEAVQQPDGSYILRNTKTGTLPASAGAAGTLPEVVVTATENAGAGTSSPAYAGGQVASGGRVGMLGERDFMNTPFSTISYTESYIQNNQAQDVMRVIGLTDAAVYVSGSANLNTVGTSVTTFGIRGFTGGAGDFAFGGLYGLTGFTRGLIEVAERVEIIKGPSALINGMAPGGSVGGSINIVPKRAGDEPLTRITGTYASDSQWGAHIDMGKRFGPEKRLGVRFNGVYRDGDTTIEHQSKTDKLGALALDWKGDSARLSMDVFAASLDQDGVDYGITMGNVTTVPEPHDAKILLSPTWSFQTTDEKTIKLQGEVDITRNMVAHAAVGRSRSEFDALIPITGTLLNTAGDFVTNAAHQRSIHDKKSIELGLRTKLELAQTHHEISLVGNQYQHDQKFGFLRGMQPVNTITNIYDPVFDSLGVENTLSHASLPKTGALKLTSFGLADTISLAGDTLQLTLGVRHQNVVSDSFNTTSGARTRYDASATTPVAALLFKPADNLSIYANYIEGLSQGSTAPVTAANAGEVFAPAKTQQKEIGLKFDTGNFANTLSVYEIKRPSSYTDPVSNVFSFGGEQRNRGVEWSFFGALTPSTRLLGGISHISPKMTRTAGGVNQGKVAAATPKWQAKLGLEWDVPGAAGLTLTGNAAYMSKQFINAENSLSIPGRTIYDLGARYATTVASHPVTVRVSVQNVGNKAYWASGRMYEGVGTPRTVFVSSTIDF